MKAIIVAAGRSSRLYPLTSATPKSLLAVGETSPLERSVDLLNAAGITDIVVVVGFCHERIRERLRGRARFVLNPYYETTNNMASLWLALPQVAGDDCVYMHADVIFHEQLLRRLLADGAGADIQLLTDFDSVDVEAMKVRVASGQFVESSKHIPLAEAAGEWVGLARCSPRAAQLLARHIELFLMAGRLQEYDTAAFNHLALAGLVFGLTPTGGLPWCEIDTHADLERARALFEPQKAGAAHVFAG